MNNYTILFILIIIQSCSWVTNNDEGEADVLARVDNSFLYKKDIFLINWYTNPKLYTLENLLLFPLIILLFKRISTLSIDPAFMAT